MTKDIHDSIFGVFLMLQNKGLRLNKLDPTSIARVRFLLRMKILQDLIIGVENEFPQMKILTHMAKGLVRE